MAPGYHSAVHPRFGLLALGTFACALTGEVRGQTLLVVGTDLPIEAGEAAGRTGTALARVDTLRVDVYTPGAVTPRETREFVVSNPSAWPFTLGAVGPVRVRLRLFAARWSDVDEDAGTRSPRPEVTVDRLVDVPATSDVQRLRVSLFGDCMGRPADVARGRTCLGAAALDGDARSPLPADDGQSMTLGSWNALREIPCDGPDDAERPCVPGGFDVLGDVNMAGVPTRAAEPLPLRPVIVSPFRLDRLEYTVGRYRALLRSGYRPSRTTKTDIQDARMNAMCTFRGESDASADALPLNCVGHAFATALCEAEGGRLPREAEWEHAASGRGQGRPFPWGATDARCCTLSISRSPRPQDGAVCTGSLLPEPAGSHPGDGCTGGGDRSRDGVLDLGGSLSEYTRDTFHSVAACAEAGVARDPECAQEARVHVVKGADWTAGPSAAHGSLRSYGVDAASTFGFRCAWPVEGSR